MVACAESRAAERGLRLTPQRRRVLEILLESHRAMGAYEVLGRLTEEGLGSQPPVVYRALEFLADLGVIHRVERLSAFVACARPGRRHRPVFLICRGCNRVAETEPEGVGGALDAAAGMIGFGIEALSVEIEGLCPDCRPEARQ
ncbi:MAG: transcriptional repressor [Alphaproteobacteria bacterium]|nr:MAG: transcriptional repressor [Alphaproteobacteria bacterium]